MADLRDEHGNPIQLTDEHGNPVQLTDEHGNPMHLTGIAVTPTHKTTTLGTAFQQERPQDIGIGGTVSTGIEHVVIDRTISSSSSSSEDDGQGGRIKKKKGLCQKIKEMLTGKSEEPKPTAATTMGPTTAVHHEQPEKKSMMEKIKEKFPGHHNH